MLKIFKNLITGNNNNNTSTNTDINLKPFNKHHSKVNYLKPFDTAFIAYYMMGFGNF